MRSVSNTSANIFPSARLIELRPLGTVLQPPLHVLLPLLLRLFTIWTIVDVAIPHRVQGQSQTEPTVTQFLCHAAGPPALGTPYHLPSTPSRTLAGNSPSFASFVSK